MRLVSFGSAGSERPGVLDDLDRLVPLDDLLRRHNMIRAGVQAILGRWSELEKPIQAELESSERLSLEGMRLGPPVTHPRGIYGIGKNYGAVSDRPPGSSVSYYDAPPIFMKPPGTLVGSNDPVSIPEGSTSVDYEVELALVIGRGGRNISIDDADKHVAGYLLVNDVTAYDLVFGTPEVDKWQSQPAAAAQLLLGKGFDSFLPCGPWLLTADSVDVESIELRLSVNGELRQTGKVAEMLLSIPAIVELISRFTTLHPGDLILTGTPPGGGIGMNPPQFLAAGDEIDASAGPLGVLSNPMRRAETVLAR